MSINARREVRKKKREIKTHVIETYYAIMKLRSITRKILQGSGNSLKKEYESIRDKLSEMYSEIYSMTESLTSSGSLDDETALKIEIEEKRIRDKYNYNDLMERREILENTSVSASASKIFSSGLVREVIVETRFFFNKDEMRWDVEDRDTIFLDSEKDLIEIVHISLSDSDSIWSVVMPGGREMVLKTAVETLLPETVREFIHEIVPLLEKKIII